MGCAKGQRSSKEITLVPGSGEALDAAGGEGLTSISAPRDAQAVNSN
jgi:hypothetical protein